MGEYEGIFVEGGRVTIVQTLVGRILRAKRSAPRAFLNYVMRKVGF